MNIPDLATLALLSFGLIYGLVRGGFREILGLVHAIASLVVPLFALDHLRAVADKAFEIPAGRGQGIVPFALGFVLVYLALLGFLWLLRRPIRRVTFSGHRIVGGVAGLLRVVLLMVAIAPVAVWFLPADAGYRKQIVESEAFTKIRRAHENVSILGRLVPPEAKDFALDLDRAGGE